MSLKKKVQEAIENFFSDGTTIERKVIAMAEEEIDEALEELRPEMRRKIDEALGDTMKTLKVGSVAVDPEKVRELLSDKVETIIEEDDDESISELLSEKLYEEIKETKLLPLLQNQESK